jgi:1-acyl-sn-glycerol-3-phosphate acyltransferase
VAIGVTAPGLGTESLVVVAETRARETRARDRIAAAITERVAAAIGVPPDQVALVPPGAVPKTSSGKIRRVETRELYVSGALGHRPRARPLARARLLARAALGELEARLRPLPRAAYTAYLAAIAVPLAAVLWPVAVLAPGRRLAVACGRLGARCLLFLGRVRVEVTGAENLPEGGAFVIAANHASYADIPVLMATLPGDFRFVAKKEVLGWPLVGRFVRKAGHLTVDRFDVQQGVADAGGIAAAIAAGARPLFFPEGTFTAATGLRPFRLGAFAAAVDAGVPVVPVALRGTRRLLRATDWRARPGRVELKVGAPIRPDGVGWRAAVALRDRVAERIASACGEPRLDLVAGGPPRA